MVALAAPLRGGHRSGGGGGGLVKLVLYRAEDRPEVVGRIADRSSGAVAGASGTAGAAGAARGSPWHVSAHT